MDAWKEEKNTFIISHQQDFFGIDMTFLHIQALPETANYFRVFSYFHLVLISLRYSELKLPHASSLHFLPSKRYNPEQRCLCSIGSFPHGVKLLELSDRPFGVWELRCFVVPVFSKCAGCWGKEEEGRERGQTPESSPLHSGRSMKLCYFTAKEYIVQVKGSKCEINLRKCSCLWL